MVERRVQAGIKLLDSNKPGWRSLVDLNDLIITHYRHCILGQVFGGFDEGLEDLGLIFLSSIDYGFTADIPYEYNVGREGRDLDTEPIWRELEETWVRALEEG